jgi:hypothetical protein
LIYRLLLSLAVVFAVLFAFADDAHAQVVRSRTVVRGGFATPIRSLAVAPFRARSNVVVNNFGVSAVPQHSFGVQFVSPQFVAPQVFVGQSFGVQSFGGFGVQSFGVRSFGCRGF